MCVKCVIKSNRYTIKHTEIVYSWINYFTKLSPTRYFSGALQLYLQYTYVSYMLNVTYNFFLEGSSPRDVQNRKAFQMETGKLMKRGGKRNQKRTLGRPGLKEGERKPTVKESRQIVGTKNYFECSSWVYSQIIIIIVY